MRVGALTNGCVWVDGFGWGCGIGSGWGGVGCVCCWHSVGRAVDGPTQCHFTYHHPVHIQHQVVSTCLPTAYAPLATPQSHNLAQTTNHHTYTTSIPPNSTPAQTLLQLTRPDPGPYPQSSVQYPNPQDTPYSLPTRPTPKPPSNPSTPPYPLDI